MRTGYRVIIWQSQKGKREWHWTCFSARNGKIVATAGEGFTRRGSATTIAKKLFPLSPVTLEQWQIDPARKRG